ncbi:MAG TPA: low affinity iron permease family protein [Herpetosiphonaceae bacterium]
MNELFRRFAIKMSDAVGSSWMFMLALGVILVWALSGPFFGFSEVWQLIINTGTTIVTFLLLFLVQNTQNRDAKAIHLKLDELLRVAEGARTGLVNLEQLSDAELKQLQDEFDRLCGPRLEKLEELEEDVDEELEERGLDDNDGALSQHEQRAVGGVATAGR